MLRILLAVLLALAPVAARAQSSPGFVPGQVVTSTQLNNAFAGKQDFSSVLSSLKTLGSSAGACSFVGFTGPNALSLYTVGSGLACVGNVLTATGAAFSLMGVTKTANYLILPGDNGVAFNNNGATGSVTFTLPPVSGNNGQTNCFLALVTQTLTIQAGASDQIVVASTAGSVGGTLTTSTVNSSVCLTANNAGQWVASSAPDGTWTQNGSLSLTLPTVVTYVPLNAANNLSDVASVATARTNLGLGTSSAVAFGSIAIGSDQFSGVFGPVSILAANTVGANTILGETVNGLPANTLALPAGVTGAGKLTANGNQAFGVYGRSECRQTLGGVCPGAEFTSANYTSNNPDTSLPPNTAIGTSTTVPNAVHVTCGAAGGETKDCSIGVYIASETGSYANPVFNTAEYIGLYRQYGLFIESMPSGTQTGLVVKGNGNGIIEQLTSTVAGSPSVAAIALNDSGGVTFSLRTNGEIYSSQTQTTVGATGAASALPANPLGYLKWQTGAGEVVVPYYNH